MSKISETAWYEKWKGFFIEAIEEESAKIEEYSKSLTETKEKSCIEPNKDPLIDKEFLKFEKSLKKQVAEFKKKIKKV